MAGLSTMHPRELIRGLMRGNREELKLGYSPANAASAARHALRSGGGDIPADSQLTMYAQGYSDGMHRRVPMASQGDTPGAESDAYCVGFVHGLQEPIVMSYPSSEAV